MPIVEDTMTMEEAELIAKAAPGGKYLVEITGVKVNEEGGVDLISESGNGMYCFYFKIVAGPYVQGELPEGGPHNGKLVKPFYVVFGSGNLAAFKRTFSEGLDERGKPNKDLIVGLQADALLGIETYGGEEGNKIVRFFPKNK